MTTALKITDDFTPLTFSRLMKKKSLISLGKEGP